MSLGRTSSRRSRLRGVPHCLIEFPQFERLVSALGHLAYHSGRLACNDAETRYDHVRGNNRTVQDPGVVLDDGKLAYHHLRSNVYVISDRGRLDDGAGADEDVVALNWMGGLIHMAPSNILALLPSLSLSKRVYGRIS